MKIEFRNLKKSSLLEEMVEERLTGSISKFPDLHSRQVCVTLSMENSPFQAGPDLFGVKVRIIAGRYQGIVLEKRSNNLYKALAEVDDHFLERLNRFGDKSRVKARNEERKFAFQNRLKSRRQAA